VEQALGFVDVQTMEKNIFKCSKTWKKEEIHKKSLKRDKNVHRLSM